MRLTTANSGVIVSLDRRTPHEPHAVGFVLEAGGGVPWLRPGTRVAYPITEATEMKVDESAYEGIEGAPGVSAQSGAPSYRTVYLIDQRHIHAVVHDHLATAARGGA